MILRARIVYPVSQPAFEDGALVISGERIVGAGRWRDLRPHLTGSVTDLGERILLPGLVNTHCHLDYTDMRGLLPPGRSFTDWIKSILALKAGWSYTEYASSWLNGARMLLQSGTTTVGDVEAVPELLPEVWEATPLRVVSFLELTSVKGRRDPDEVIGEALDRFDRLRSRRSLVSFSPHAPYSTHEQLLRTAARVSLRRRTRLMTHVAESNEEFAMFANAQGPLYEWLRWNQRDMSDCGSGSPIQYLDRIGYLSPNLVAVHLNYLAEGDAARLARSGVQAVHCPRSHDYFQHRRFPLEALEAERIPVALGTDSLATVRCPKGQSVRLDMFEEMRELQRHRPWLPPERIVEMATVQGAAVLGFGRRMGVLESGALADLIAVPFAGESSQAAEALLNHHGPVHASMIGGEWAVPPQSASTEAAAA